MGLLSNRRRYSKPYDYEVEYLEVDESNAGTYITTPYIINDYDNDIYTKIMINGYSNNASTMTVVGSGYTQNVNLYRISRGLSGNDYIRLYNGIYNANPTEYNIELGQVLDIKMPRNGNFTINGQPYTQDNSRRANTNKDPLIFFKRSGTEPVCYMRLYSFKWVKGDKAVLDMIPVVKDGVGYMYDRISKKLYGAEGGGKFKVGQRIN